MLKKTSDYDIFTLRDDNREKISTSHVNHLAESIKSRNLLELRPILVNHKMEVIDGQHRLLAAKKLGVEIYYKIEDQLDSKEIILMNTAKSWGLSDFLNFYVKNGYPEYVKMNDMMKKHQLNLQVCLHLLLDNVKGFYSDFKFGKFVFPEKDWESILNICNDTIATIKRHGSYSMFVRSARFWKPLVKLVSDHNFNREKWMENLTRHIDKISARANEKGYARVFMDIYNWRNNQKIDILHEEL